MGSQDISKIVCFYLRSHGYKHSLQVFYSTIASEAPAISLLILVPEIVPIGITLISACIVCLFMVTYLPYIYPINNVDINPLIVIITVGKKYH